MHIHHAGIRLTCFDRFADGWEEEDLPFRLETEEWMEMYLFLVYIVTCSMA